MSILRLVLEAGLSKEEQEELYRNNKNGTLARTAVGAGVGGGVGYLRQGNKNNALQARIDKANAKGKTAPAANFGSQNRAGLVGAAVGAGVGAASGLSGNSGLKAGIAGGRKKFGTGKGALAGLVTGAAAGRSLTSAAVGAGLGAYVGHQYSKNYKIGQKLAKERMKRNGMIKP